MESPPFVLSELVHAYSLDASEHSDFFWVFVTRTFYYMCVSLQVREAATWVGEE